MVNLEDAGIKYKKIQIHQPDFDISQFCTLMEKYKSTWRSVFQSILFRAFKSGRSTIKNCQQILLKLSFNK